MILIDATALQSEHRLRGVGAYVRQLILAIEQQGVVQPWYLVSSLGREGLDGVVPEDRTVRMARPHRPAQVYWLYNEYFMRAALRRTRPKVFLAPDFNGLVPNPFGATVAVLHDLTALKLAVPTGRTSLSAALSDLRWRAYYRKLQRVHHIIAVSHSSRRDAAERLAVPASRIHVVHHGVDHNLFRPAHGRGTYADHGPYFVHIGGRNDNKNQARLLQAFATTAAGHPDVQLYFAGPWNAADLGWLADERDRLGVAQRVRHLGYVPEGDLPSLYGNAVAFVFPSLEEGFGLPVLEAMACGAPVITSNRSSMGEVADDAAVLVDPLSAAAIAVAMTRLLDDVPERDRLRQRGFRRAAAFTWQRTAEATVDVLEGAG